MRFNLLSPVSNSLAPFCLGFAFKKGDVPAGNSVATDISTFQVVPKNYWPDGSLKFAIMAGRAALSAGATRTFDLRVAAPPRTAAPLGLAELKSTGVVAQVACGTYGTVTWSGSDWDSPFKAWISGPEMSSWLYRRPVGSDAHLVAWLEVRLFAGGAVEVLPWIENGYLKVASPSSKSSTFSFTLGGSQRFNQPINLANHCRTPLVSGSVTSYWLDTAVDVSVKHDATYIKSTLLVPNYGASVSPSATIVANLVRSFTPLQQGGYSSVMGSAGYQPAIGLLPQWDVLHLATTSNSTWNAVQFNAYSAGRYGIHFRDEATNRPIKFSSWPHLVCGQGGVDSIVDKGQSSTNEYTAGSSGPTYPETWDTPHHPSIGYFAYLATGRFYFLEECQFVACLNYLKNDDDVRQGSSGIMRSDVGACTTRGAAWALRSLAQAAAATPDDDTLKVDFVASLEANVNYYHALYVAQSNCPQGWVKPYYTDGTEAPWQQDFFTASIGYALALDVIGSAAKTKLQQFFGWKAQSVIGRLGGTGPTEYGYSDAAAYQFNITPTIKTDWSGGTGPWYANWGAQYLNQFGVSNPSVAPGLRGGNFPDGSSYWGNLQPAIAYAVQNNIPGAAAAYARMIGDADWPKLLADWTTRGVEWSVAPI